VTVYISEGSEVQGKAQVHWLKGTPREGWDFDFSMGARHIYASYDEMKSLWFELGAALSQYEDEMEMNAPWNNAPVPFVPVMPPAVAEYVETGLTLEDPYEGQNLDALGWFTEFGGKAHILRGPLDNTFRGWSLCGLRLHSGHPRREGEQPCLNCRDSALAAAASHRETRPKVDGEFALSQEVCLERLARHEWRWGNRSIDGDQARTRRYCVNCGTYFGDGGAL
jgi:hypothetical protein